MTIETSIAQESLFVASTQMGIREEGNNGGPEVSRYLRAVGLGPGYAWCMAFIYWCTDIACKRLGEANPLIKTGGVIDQWNRTSLRKIQKIDKSVKLGDIFIIDFGGGKGHTGFVLEINGGWVKTIEGNTNDSGSREGYEVASRSRALSEFKGFIQLP